MPDVESLISGFIPLFNFIINFILSKNVLYPLGILIILSGVFGPFNKFIRLGEKRDGFKESVAARYRRGSLDNTVSDLSFYSTGNRPNVTDPERPSKILFDKNDPSGQLLGIIYPGATYIKCDFVRNGVPYVGLTSHSFSNTTREVGTMERVNNNCFSITTIRPPQYIMDELQRRNIIVSTGGLPLTPVRVDAPTRTGRIQEYTYVYIYANRNDAIGVFDESTLPQ